MVATEPFNHSLSVWAIWCLLPPLFLTLKVLEKSPLPNWLSLVLFCLIGWGLILGATELHFVYLRELTLFVPIEEQRAIMEKWAADGGPKLEALIGGWLYSLIYFGVWWGLFRIFFFFRTRGRKA
jgi:hypothetical protein